MAMWKRRVIKAGNRKDEAMKTRISWLIGLMVLGVAAAWMLAGCEAYSSDGRDITISKSPDADGYTNDVYHAITFTAFGGGAVTNLSAKAGAGTNDLPTAASNDRLYYPLEWSVSNPDIGMIISQSGSSAVFQTYRGRLGSTAITCRDQSEREGMATVTLVPSTNYAAYTNSTFAQE